MGTHTWMLETEGQLGSGSLHLSHDDDNSVDDVSLQLEDIMQQEQDRVRRNPQHLISWGSFDSDEEESLIGSIVVIEHRGTRENEEEMILVNGDKPRQKTTATSRRRNRMNTMLCVSNDNDGQGSPQQPERVSVASQWIISEVMNSYRFNE